MSAPIAWVQTLQRSWWAPRPSALTLLLHPLSMLYAALAQLHKLVERPRRIGVPVLVVGNLVVGGAGKTPTVIAVVRILRAYGWHPGVVSRGYGRSGTQSLDVEPSTAAAQCGDEPLLIRMRTGVPVFVDADRSNAATMLLRAHPEVDIVVSDDGLQHHRLARDLAVVVFDERCAGNRQLLPAGPLRERLAVVTPPDMLVLYNAAEPTTSWPGWMAQARLSGVLPLAEWAAGSMPDTDSWAALRGRRVLAAAGIAVPDRFFAALRDKALDIEPLPLPDHHRFDTVPWPADTADVVVTEKDAVKLRDRELGATRVWVAPLDFEPDLGFAAALKRHFPKPPPR